MLIRDFPKPKKKNAVVVLLLNTRTLWDVLEFPPQNERISSCKGTISKQKCCLPFPSGATVQYVSFRGSRGFILPSYSGIILQGMIRIPMNQSVYWKYWNVILGGWANPNILSTVTQPPTFWNLLLERYLSNGMFEALQGHFAWLGEASTQFTPGWGVAKRSLNKWEGKNRKGEITLFFGDQTMHTSMVIFEEFTLSALFGLSSKKKWPLKDERFLCEIPAFF